MGTKRSEYKARFAKCRRRNLDDEAIVLRMAAAFDKMIKSGRPSDERLNVIIDGTTYSRGLVWESAWDLLGESLRKWPEIAPSIAKMLEHGKARVRQAAMYCIGDEMPAQIADDMIRMGLADKSGLIRCIAAGAASRLKKKNFIPALTKVVRAEKPGSTRRDLQLSLGLLRDGYVINSLSGGNISVCIPIAVGICSRIFSKSELKERGIDALVAEIRANRLPFE